MRGSRRACGGCARGSGEDNYMAYVFLGTKQKISSLALGGAGPDAQRVHHPLAHHLPALPLRAPLPSSSSSSAGAGYINRSMYLESTTISPVRYPRHHVWLAVEFMARASCGIPVACISIKIARQACRSGSQCFACGPRKCGTKYSISARKARAGARPREKGRVSESRCPRVRTIPTKRETHPISPRARVAKQ